MFIFSIQKRCRSKENVFALSLSFPFRGRFLLPDVMRDILHRSLQKIRTETENVPPDLVVSCWLAIFATQ